MIIYIYSYIKLYKLYNYTESTSTSEESKPTVPSNEGAEHEKPDLNIAASPPEFSIQKSEIQPLLSQKLRKGDEW